MLSKRVIFSIALFLMGGESLCKDAATIKQELSTLLSPGRKVRVAWSQGSVNDFTLYGVDSDDGQIRELTPTSLFASGRRKVTVPFITRDGRRVVFAEEIGANIYVIDWNGTGLTKLASGTCAAGTWQDPNNTTKQYAIIGGSLININNTADTRQISPSYCLVGDNDGYGISIDGLRYGSFLCDGSSGIAPTPNGQAVCNRCGGCNFAMRPTVGVYEYGHFPPGGHATIHIHNADGSLKQDADVSSTVKSKCTDGEPVNLVWSNDPDVVVYQWQNCRHNPVLFRLSDKKSVTIRDDLQGTYVVGVDAVFFSSTEIEKDVILRKVRWSEQLIDRGVAYSLRGERMTLHSASPSYAGTTHRIAIVVDQDGRSSRGALIVY